MDPAIAIAILFRFDFEGILADPIRLGIFLEFAQTIIEPRAQEAAITLALRGKEIPWSLGRREGNRFVESDHVRELPLQCPTSRLPAPLEIVAKILGNVSENRWQMLGEATGRPDGEKEVSQCGTTVFLKQGIREATTKK
jgi:hypothetical protein